MISTSGLSGFKNVELLCRHFMIYQSMIELDEDIRSIVGGYLEDAERRFIEEKDLWF